MSFDTNALLVPEGPVIAPFQRNRIETTQRPNDLEAAREQCRNLWDVLPLYQLLYTSSESGLYRFEEQYDRPWNVLITM